MHVEVQAKSAGMDIIKLTFHIIIWDALQCSCLTLDQSCLIPEQSSTIPTDYRTHTADTTAKQSCYLNRALQHLLQFDCGLAQYTLPVVLSSSPPPIHNVNLNTLPPPPPPPLQDLPIDIHTNKLLDWLVSRRHCEKNWQETVLTIREKISHAIQDMPEHPDIVRLLSGARQYSGRILSGYCPAYVSTRYSGTTAASVIFILVTLVLE